MDKVDEALKVLDRVLWRSDGISPEDYADAEIARETLRDELRRLRAERDELRAACEELCDFYERYTGVIATKARAALSRTEGGEVGG